MVIRALVRARLLGMQLLTLEARVVVGTDGGSHTVASPLVLSPHRPGGPGSRYPGRGLASSGSVPGLVRAIDLLEQGTETLERSRRTGRKPLED
jgi:hypothetical protein